MRNVRKQIKHGDENSFKIQNKYKINHKIPQLERKNHTQKELNKEQNSLINFKTNKEPLISQKKINKKLFLIPKFNLNTEKNRTIIEFNTVDNDLNLNLDNITKHKKLLFPITNNNNDEIIYKEKNNSVENNHNKIYVHKKLKNANKKIMNISRNDKSNQNIKFRNTFFQTNKNKDYYQNLIFFPNKPKIFKKKQLSDIENMDSEEVENKIPNIKYLNRSPIAKKKRIFFEVPLNENLTNTNDESFNKINDNYNDDCPDDIETRLDNLNDYINICSINNKTVENDNSNMLEEEDKIVIKKKNNKIRHKNLFINTSKINNIKNDPKKNEDNNTININKNIIINKKIILFPEENNNCSKTSYGFFNTFTNKYKNIINMPYSNRTERYINKFNKYNKFSQNINFNNNRNLSLSKTNSTLNNFIYKRKNFYSKSPRSSRYINSFTEYNNSQSNKNFTNLFNKNNIAYQMSNTSVEFYQPKKNYFYKNKENISNKSNKSLNNQKSFETKGRLQNDKDKDEVYVNYKLNSSKDLIKVNQNPNILIINDKNENEEIKIKPKKVNIKFSILDICKYLETKLKTILNKLIKYQNCEKDCYDFINYYFENNFCQEKINIFKNVKNKEILTNLTKMEIINVYICYDILCSKKFNKACIVLKTIISLLYDNFVLILILIVRNNNENKNKDILKNLNLIINEYISKKNYFKKNNINENKIIEIIEKNSNETINYYKMLIDSFYSKNYSEKEKESLNKIKFPEYIKNINPKNSEKNNNNKIKNIICHFFNESYKKTHDFIIDELKSFFYQILIHSKNDTKTDSKTDKNTKKYKIFDKPANIKVIKQFILPPIKNNYKYSLILNLDETLVYRKNILILRPYLNEFLHEMKYLYEIIIFSDTSKEYTYFIADIIQQKEKYFSYILNNKYITYNNKNDKIKDLSILGRELNNIVIVDSNDKYYKRNKANLICIKPFYGDLNIDKNILKFLSNFLKELITDNEKVGDIRISLNNLKYKLYPIVINNLD